MSTGEYIPVNSLTPLEAGFLHPANWQGETIGHTVPESGRLTDFVPVRVKPQHLPGILKSTEKGHAARARAAANPQRFGPRAVYMPGQEFRIADQSPDDIVVFDQSTLITRGKEFHLKPEEFPPQPPFNLHPYAPADHYYAGSGRLHYVREYAPTATVGKGADAKVARIGSLDLHTGFNEQPYAAGMLALPEVVKIGEPVHYRTSDNQQILSNAHAVYVFPGPHSGRQ